MQQTTKYQFKLIEGSDDFSPQPLNDNVEKVEDVLSGMESTMEDALEEMETAVCAAYSPDNKPYVAGNYQGTAMQQHISLGFLPSALVIGQNLSSSDEAHYGTCTLIIGSGLYDRVLIMDNGFTLLSNASDEFPSVNRAHCSYFYIAFR